MTVVSVPVIKLWGEKSLCCLASRPCDLMQYILIMGYKTHVIHLVIPDSNEATTVNETILEFFCSF